MLKCSLHCIKPEDLLNGEEDESLNEQQDEQSALSKEVLQSQINGMLYYKHLLLLQIQPKLYSAP